MVARKRGCVVRSPDKTSANRATKSIRSVLKRSGYYKTARIPDRLSRCRYAHDPARFWLAIFVDIKVSIRLAPRCRYFIERALRYELALELRKRKRYVNFLRLSACRHQKWLLLGLAVVSGRYVLVGPVQNDVSDLKVICTQHHHVGRAFEGRLPELVQFDVLRLRDSMTCGAPGVYRVNRRLTYRACGRVVSLQSQIRDIVEVLRSEPAVRKRAGAFDCDQAFQHVQMTPFLQNPGHNGGP